MKGYTVLALLSTALLVIIMASCSGSQVDLSKGNDSSSAKFVPFVADYGVDIFVDKVDGKTTKFGELDSVLIDPGSHELVVRLEYQPAAGITIVEGGIANILLRAATNRTFVATITVDVDANNVYKLLAKSAPGDQIDLIVFNENLEKEELKHSFAMKDGRFERVY